MCTVPSLATVVCSLVLFSVAVTAIPSPGPTPAPLDQRKARAAIIRDTIPSLIKRQSMNGSLADSIPEKCQTTCAYTIQFIDACTKSNSTEACLAVCTPRGMNSLIECANCVYETWTNVTYQEWQDLYSAVSGIQTNCERNGRPVTATAQWDQWLPPSPPPPPPPPPPPDPSPTPVGAIVGGVVGGIAALTALIFLILWLRRRKRRRASPDLAPRAYTDASPPMSAIQPSTSSQNANSKFSIDPAVSPYGAASTSESSTSHGRGSEAVSAALAAAYTTSPTSQNMNCQMPPLPDVPLENPHRLSPGAAKAQAAAISAPEEVEFVRHVDAGRSDNGSVVGEEGRRTIIELPPRYQDPQ